MGQLVALRPGLVGPQMADEPVIRESAWKDPKTWLTFAGLVITVGIFLFGFIASRLYTIDGRLEAIVIANTQNSTEIKQIKDEQRDQKDALKALEQKVDANDRRQADYNYNLSTRLSKQEAKEK